jgi:hypothetical protein
MYGIGVCAVVTCVLLLVACLVTACLRWSWLWSSWSEWADFPVSSFMQIHSAGIELLQGRRTDGRTDMTKLIGAISVTVLHEHAQVRTTRTLGICNKDNEIYLKWLTFTQTQLNYRKYQIVIKLQSSHPSVWPPSTLHIVPPSIGLCSCSSFPLSTPPAKR